MISGEPCGAYVVTEWIQGSAATLRWCGRVAGPDSYFLARETEQAIEHVLEIFEHPEDQDCDECFDRWMESASGEREIDDFPEQLDEEHVIRIMALEDAVLVRHALDQWLIALAARRRKAGSPELALPVGGRRGAPGGRRGGA